MSDAIHLTGVRVHYLKNFPVSMQKNRILVVTGVSGSGKYLLVSGTVSME